MSMQLKKGPSQRAFVSTALIALLIAVGLLALVEKGPAAPGIPIGASPLNPMALGTSHLVDLAARNYSTLVAYSFRELGNVDGGLCVYFTISPELPYTVKEAKTVISILRERCSKLKVFVADESTYSNPLLQVLNSSIRIDGNRIYIAIATGVKEVSSGLALIALNLSSPYPPAEIIVRDIHRLVLDKASSVSGGIPTGQAYTYSDRGILCLVNSSGDVYRCASTFDIASKEVVNGVNVFVIGDGSILLNQVLASNKSEYLAFARDLLSYLCEDSPHCTIIFDAMHYPSISPRDILSNPSYSIQKLVRDPTTLLYTTISILAVLLHPSLWLPPLILGLSSLLTVLVTGFVSAIIIFIFTLVIYRILMSGARTSRDYRLPEQVEEEIGVFAELRKTIASGKAKLSKQDFVALCQTLDTLLKFYSGSGLWSEYALNVLAELIGDEKKAYRELQWVLKMYGKAIGRGRLSLFVSWGRAVKRLMGLVEEVGERISERLGVSII